MIVDAHAHIFPPLGGASGFATAAKHRLHLELYLATHPQPTRRLSDHRQSYGGVLGDGRYERSDCFTGSDFRVGPYGRFEWTTGGERYYRQFLPPSLQRMEAPADFLRQEMAYAGVDTVVLQNARLYGRLNEYFADACRAHPGTFIPLADVDEPRADTPTEVARLERAVRDQGMRGIYYATRGHFADGYRRSFEDPAFDGYWDAVRRLGIPVFWEIIGVPLPTPAAYLDQIDRLNHWADRFPDIRCVLTHGIDVEFLRTDLPEPLRALLAREQFLIELLYPISQGRLDDYPYRTVHPAVRHLYGLVGGKRLIWGSDMPNVQRHCTYRQSLTYLQDYCPFVGSADMAAIVGDNVKGLFDR